MRVLYPSFESALETGCGTSQRRGGECRGFGNGQIASRPRKRHLQACDQVYCKITQKSRIFGGGPRRAT